MRSPSKSDVAPAAAAGVCSFFPSPLSGKPPFIAGEVVFVALSYLSPEQCYELGYVRIFSRF